MGPHVHLTSNVIIQRFVVGHFGQVCWLQKKTDALNEQQTNKLRANHYVMDHLIRAVQN